MKMQYFVRLPVTDSDLLYFGTGVPDGTADLASERAAVAVAFPAGSRGPCPYQIHDPSIHLRATGLQVHEPARSSSCPPLRNFQFRFHI